MSNPFIDGNKNGGPQTNMMERVLSMKPKVNIQMKSYTPPTFADKEDPENKRNSGNNTQEPINIINTQPKLQQQPQSSFKPINPVIPQKSFTNNDKAQFEVKINEQVCLVSKLSNKPLKNVTELTQQNIKTTIPEPLRQSISTKIEGTQYILNTLALLYENILDNNQFILSAIKNNQDYRPRKDQHDRLKLGLFYYRSVNNESIRLLTVALQRHVFGKLINLISQRLNLDALKAYYVVRSIHEQKGFINKGSRSFFIEESTRIIPDNEAIQLAENFIENDKRNLLKIYSQILSCSKPSRFRIFKFRDELDILWGNLFNLPNQNVNNQQIIIDIFLKYWSLAQDDQKTSKSELSAMRQKFLQLSLNVKDTLRTKLIGIGISNLLKEDISQLKESDFQGPFRQIFKFFLQLNENEFNYQLAFSNIKKIDITKQWFKHIETAIRKIKFLKGDAYNLQKSLYIHEVLMNLKEKNIQLCLDAQEELMKKVMKTCSIIVSAKFLGNLFAHLSSPSLLTFLSQSQDELKHIYTKQAYEVFQWTSSFSCEHLMEVKLAVIQRIIVNCIKLGDIQSLERQISNGKAGWINFDDENDNFQFVKRYCQQFPKFPSLLQKIQVNINEVIMLMKSNDIKISKSLQFYHKKLLRYCRDPKMLTKHLNFLYTTDCSINQLSQHSQELLRKVEQEGISSSFNNIHQTIQMFGQKIIDTDQQQLLNTYLELIRIFQNEILALTETTPLPLEAIHIYYTMSKVAEWANFNKLPTPSLIGLLAEIRQSVCRQSEPLSQFIQRIQHLSSSNKLFILCQHINSHEKGLNLLNRYLSVNKEFKHYLYDKISQQVKKQAGQINKQGGINAITILETFSLAAEYDDELFQILLSKNLGNLKDYLPSSSISLTSINHQLNIGFVIASSSKFQNRPPVNNLLMLFVIRALLACQTKKIPKAIFSKLLKLCAQSMNRIDYATHMKCLIKALQDISGHDMIEQFDEHFSQFILYLICLFISKLRKIDPKSIDNKVRLTNETRIFGILANIILQVITNIMPLHIDFIRNYLQLLEFFLNFPLLFEFMSDQFRTIKVSFRERINAPVEINALIPLFNKIQSIVQRQNGLHSSSKDTSAQAYKEAYQRQIKNFFKNIGKIKKIENKNEEIKNIQELIMNSKPKLKMKMKIIIKYPINLNFLIQKSMFYLKFAHLLTIKIAWQKASLQQVGKQFRKFLTDFEIKWFVTEKYQWITAFKLYLSIYNELIESSVQSSLVLYTKTIKQKIVNSLQELIGTLRFWMKPPNNQFFTLLDSISLEVSHIPGCWKSQKSDQLYKNIFTSWDLLIYREKLELLRAIIRFYRLMNGLLPFDCILINDFLPLFSFFAENMVSFTSEDNQEKIKAANILIQCGKNQRIDDDDSLIQEPISLIKLRETCREISNDFQYLNYELTPKAYEMLDKLNQQINLMI